MLTQRSYYIIGTILLAVILGIVFWTTRPIARPYMVASANLYASRAGVEILKAGGSAVDAAIAVQLVLTLVEPQSSGIGGGAFMLHWSPETEVLDAYDGRETAPQAVKPDLFLDEAGRPLPYFDAVVNGRSVGTPGVIAMLWMAHKEYGRLPWARLFDPAIALARDGFTVSPRLSEFIASSPVLPKLPQSRAYFFRADAEGNMVPLAAGAHLTNPELAETFTQIANHGADAFYRGEIAQKIVSTVQHGPVKPGALTLQDLANYQAKKRAAICEAYRIYKVCSMPPPTSGGLAELQILGILNHFDLAAHAPSSIEAIHFITEASRLAYADRDLYVGDPDFVDVPVADLLDPDYLKGRADLVDPSRSMGTAAPGTLPGRQAFDWAPNRSIALPSTSHFSILDADGNVVSMTSSVEAPFGSQLMAGGFFLNNQLTDFSFVPEENGRPVANAVGPGKRPRSSMAPTIIFNEDGDFFAAVGSPGGSRIPLYVTQTVIGLIDWNLSMQQAIDLPRHVDRNGPLEIEAGTDLEIKADALRSLGHEVTAIEFNSGLHGIRVTDDGVDGGADPRREGVALGGEIELAR